ncbi:hypothetical protein AUC69_12890 [Methyloceanibacter superfactus]|uniref:Uncharacterized protein n=1 Tax=Methyloceanibacter superfactus TaxID=1774969 RepID=A0A1E3VU25_9HYPH|nr:DUF6790 family protein [Methyloceanibacter superfactus]ODR97019.1 hypothetical protein AUC69_12890 [Methyloceanibacter superfactus]
MIGFFIVALSIVLPLVHLAVTKRRAPGAHRAHPAALCAPHRVGVMGFLFGFIPHVFFPDEAAKAIGWSPSPFQFEVGVHDGAWGVLGFLCLWIGGLFWLATGLGWSLFMLGAAGGHVYQTVTAGNYAPYNFLMIFTDGFVALWLLLLLYLHYRCGGMRGQGES